MKCDRRITPLVMGIGIGAAMGAATGQMGLWLGMGAGLGAAMMSLLAGREVDCLRRKRDRRGPPQA
ncbi:hypothetical protein [Pseudoxanthomonas sp. JBR18]|uniref:hypothetical protein n=1 Tax=Pseudoxanthomonas sp. JBR18 TaxID=2969308 RepID=UPI00230542C0|nr:hypothetical protein [Pseudoxanthomonas sp. JBR18]WCE04170.1 hypothetical protein PJ250_19190 [Pseudoxanthomonas sp. JBR18]